EFVPHDEKGQMEMARVMDISYSDIHERVESLMESNPMLGLRGCRLGNLYPEITEMQTRAIIEAALELKREGIKAIPEIMVPLTGIVYEFQAQKEIIEKTIQQVFSENSDSIEYKIGTMIEIPRAALTAHKIAKEADFFSFG
ncbi:MAG TPA: pyruvate, phosphate dikinase, partial [Porphyromonadaceae bacterium]|nr:pyruvate, phosphate dikinase [Porphyromonadaceae bacterium]